MNLDRAPQTEPEMARAVEVTAVARLPASVTLKAAVNEARVSRAGMASTSKAAASGSKPAAPAGKLTALEAKLAKIGLQAPLKTISMPDLLREAKVGSNSTTMDALNSLLRKNMCTLLRSQSGELSYRFQDRNEAKAMGSMDAEEKLVLDQIKDAGNMGIWTKDITTRTGLLRTSITKCLKALEQRKMIKNVKSVKNPTRKIYMLAGLTPSVDITGGPWFTDNELDVEFVGELKQLTQRFLQEKTVYKTDKSLLFPTTSTPFLPTVAQIRQFVSKAVIAVELADEHIESLLDLMVFEGSVEKILVFGVQGNKRSRDAEESDDPAEGGKRRKLTKDGKKAVVRKDAKSKKADKSKKKKKTTAKRSLLNGAESDSDESSESDFDSDEEAKPSTSGASKRRKKRRARPASPASDDDNAADGNASDSVSSLSGSDDDHPADREDEEEHSLNDYVYRWKRVYEPTIGWTDMPCGLCPVERFCSESQARPAVKKLKAGVEMQGVGMLGGAGAAIGISGERWGEVGGQVGAGVSPVNPKDCRYFAEWLDF